MSSETPTDLKSASKPNAISETSAPTHAAIPLTMLGSISRVLQRTAMDGQEAVELLQALQTIRPISLQRSPDEPSA